MLWICAVCGILQNRSRSLASEAKYGTTLSRKCRGCVEKEGEWRIANKTPLLGAVFRYDEWLLMNDAQIRAATKNALLVQHMGDAETVIFEELGVQHGLARIDLAVVNGELHGFELKSARDTLARLPEQAESYGRLFDRVTLVVEERHVRGAVDLVPDWWGVRVACQESGKLRFCDLRHAVKNPSPDPAAIVALLWREEALHFLEELGIAGGVRWKCRAEIYSRIVTKTDIDVLCHRVRTCLRKRLNWRSAATRLSCGG